MLIQRQRLYSPLKGSPAKELIRKDGLTPTIGHMVLTEDSRAETIQQSVFDRLNDVISNVESSVTVGTTVTTIDQARAILQQIEQVIIAMNFVCTIPDFLVSTFAQGLLPRALDPVVINNSENDLRRVQISAHSGEMFSHVDCDLSSLLYVSIGEKLDIPLCMVEIPNHNFVRWRLSDSLHLNWDTNYGFDKFSDSQYALTGHITSEQIVNGIYLADLSTNNSKGYFSFVRGLTFQSNNMLSEALNEYRNATQLYPKSPSARNNAAWLYVSSRPAQAFITGTEAIAMGEKARQLVMNDSNILDTLACAYAEYGDFTKAIEIETAAYNMTPNPEYQRMITAFGMGQTWLDVHP